MAKRITAKVDEYQKDGQTKGKYVEIGVILSNDKGEYMILDPSVSLSGVLQKQNILAANAGKSIRSSVMCGIWDSENSGGGAQQSPSQRAQAPQATKQAASFDDDIPWD